MSPSSVTYGTSNEHETNERVQELSDYLRELGYSKDDVRHHSEVLRRLSNESDHMDPQQFIAVMLEVDDEFSSEEDTKEKRRPPSPPKKSHSGLKKINPAAAMGYLRTLPICTERFSQSWDLAKMKSDDTLIYRRHSDNINTQQYISVMLEAEDDF